MAKEAKRIGRPTKVPARGKRVSLGLKVTADIKRRLDAAAQASGRTQSQEAEYRIELSYSYERALGEYEQAKKKLAEIVQGSAEAALGRLGWKAVSDLKWGGTVYLPPGRLDIPQSSWLDPNKPSPPIPPIEIIPEQWLKDLDDAINRKIEQAVDRIVDRLKVALNKEGGK
jgi:predicted transcriptional regulator